MPANLDIVSTVSGQDMLKALENQLMQINNQTRQMNNVNQIASAQNKVQIAQLAQENKLLMGKLTLRDGEVRGLAHLMNLNENLTFVTQNRLSVEQEALRLRQQFAQEGIMISVEEARVATETNRQIIQSEMELLTAMRNKARALMQVSISLFVMNISANQLVSSLKPLVKENETATQALTDFQAVLNLTLGPLQAYLALLQITNAMQMQMTQTVGMLGLALGAMMIMFFAIRQESPAIRAALGAISGALIGVTILAYQAALAKTMFAGALQLAVSSMGGPVGFAIGLAAAGAGLAVMIGYIAKAKSAQTNVGQMKRITRGGLAEVHEGEIYRPPSGTRGDEMGMGGDINIYLPDTYDGTVAQSKRFANETNRLLRSGRATVRVKRVVVS